ncbi:hypothetical protein [Streptomyces sp. 7N604]|uniref:hypothetical protein n=1 Tax=Streptomyces sp. 7N604 TaxID=3457415 RepID=UPI003FD18B40
MGETLLTVTHDFPPLGKAHASPFPHINLPLPIWDTVHRLCHTAAAHMPWSAPTQSGFLDVVSYENRSTPARGAGMGTKNVKSPGTECLLVDPEVIGETVDTALAVTLAVPGRPQIDATTRDLIGHLEQLLAGDLGFDEDSVVRGMYREAYRLLELNHRPTHEETHFRAFEYMRELAQLTRGLANVYRKLHEMDEADG